VPVARRWALAVQGEWSHLITMPGVSAEAIDDFVQDLVNSTRASLKTTAKSAKCADCPGPATARSGSATPSAEGRTSRPGPGGPGGSGAWAPQV
jgi:hypothetical protein